MVPLLVDPPRPLAEEQVRGAHAHPQPPSSQHHHKDQELGRALREKPVHHGVPHNDGRTEKIKR